METAEERSVAVEDVLDHVTDWELEEYLELHLNPIWRRYSRRN